MRFNLVHLDEVDAGRCARGHADITPDVDYFREHFPGYPVVPGVLIVESLAQVGGRLLQATVRARGSNPVLPVLAQIDRAQFHRAVRPGSRLDLEANITWVGDSSARVSTTARVAGARVALAGLMYALISIEHGATGLDGDAVTALGIWADSVWQATRRTAPKP